MADQTSDGEMAPTAAAKGDGGQQGRRRLRRERYLLDDGQRPGEEEQRGVAEDGIQTSGPGPLGAGAEQGAAGGGDETAAQRQELRQAAAEPVGDEAFVNDSCLGGSWRVVYDDRDWCTRFHWTRRVVAVGGVGGGGGGWAEGGGGGGQGGRGSSGARSAAVAHPRASMCHGQWPATGGAGRGGGERVSAFGPRRSCSTWFPAPLPYTFVRMHALAGRSYPSFLSLLGSLCVHMCLHGAPPLTAPPLHRPWKLSPQSKASVTWEVPQGTPPGTYRIRYNGDAKTLLGAVRPFQGCTAPFEVAAAPGPAPGEA